MQRISATGVFLQASELDLVKTAIVGGIAAADAYLTDVENGVEGNLHGVFSSRNNAEAYRRTMVQFQIDLDAERAK